MRYFASTVWHAPHGRPDSTKLIIKQLSDIQRECLRVVSGSFRATSQSIVKAETHVMLIDLHMAQLQVKARKRQQIHDHDARIEAFCERIKRKLSASRERRRQKFDKTSTQRKREWYARQVTQVASNDMKADGLINKSLVGIFKRRWRQAWIEYQTTNARHSCVAIQEELSQKRLQAHWFSQLFFYASRFHFRFADVRLRMS